MQTITDMNCRLNTVEATWTIELIFDDQSGMHSFSLKDASSVETFLEVFEDCTSCRFDPETKDVVFAFEYMSGEDGEDLSPEDGQGSVVFHGWGAGVDSVEVTGSVVVGVEPVPVVSAPLLRRRRML